MSKPTRRRLLGSGAALAAGALAGCLANAGGSDAESPDASDGNPSEDSNESNVDAPLTEWERATDCEGDPDRQHDSVVSVERTATSLEDEYVPIRFSKLTPEEADILGAVTEDGGYGTCSPSDAFHRFLERVTDRTEQQDDGTRVYLEREGTYYGLYVEFGDEVYAY